jgi:hypothetical protein
MENINKIIELLIAEQKKYPENSPQYAMIDAAGMTMDALNTINCKKCNNSEEVINFLTEAAASIITSMKIIMASKTAEATKVAHQARQGTHMN